MQNIPQHVAIIMDGNRRWAMKQGLLKIAGHEKGIKSIEKILEAAKEMGVKILTLYTFSTENWRRSKEEVGALMKILGWYLDNESKKLFDKGIKLATIGRLDRLNASLIRKLEKVKDLTKSNEDLLLNLAIDYGSRDEIIHASRMLASDVKNGKIKESDINETVFADYLYTKGLPDPDLLIRTGGDLRLSNFLLWQISYSEIYVTKKLWPDFCEKDFKDAIAAYQNRDRRIGN